MAFRLRIQGLAGGVALPSSDPVGAWIQHLDTSGGPGRECAVLTRSTEEAAGFDTFAEAMAYWRQEHGTRHDGEPHRPLTVFTVEIERVTP